MLAGTTKNNNTDHSPHTYPTYLLLLLLMQPSFTSAMWPGYYQRRDQRGTKRAYDSDSEPEEYFENLEGSSTNAVSNGLEGPLDGRDGRARDAAITRNFQLKTLKRLKHTLQVGTLESKGARAVGRPDMHEWLHPSTAPQTAPQKTQKLQKEDSIRRATQEESDLRDLRAMAMADADRRAKQESDLRAMADANRRATPESNLRAMADYNRRAKEYVRLAKEDANRRATQYSGLATE